MLLPKLYHFQIHLVNVKKEMHSTVYIFMLLINFAKYVFTQYAQIFLMISPEQYGLNKNSRIINCYASVLFLLHLK